MEAAAAAMLVCLFDDNGAETPIPLLDYDAGVWHGFVPGAGFGQAYGYRAGGDYDPGSGLRFNPAKLLLDPYARAFAAWWQPLDFTIPAIRAGTTWQTAIDTYDPTRPATAAPLRAGAQLTVSPRSITVLRNPLPADGRPA